MIPYPQIDPILVQIGPLAVRWYGLAYLAGLILGSLWARPFLTRLSLSRDAQWDFLFYLALGVFLGGRLGYVVVYDLPFYLQHPFQLAAVWQGGMSFHGGLVGAALASWLFARRVGVSVWSLWDCVSVAAPIGLMFGRLANFVNGELFGRAAHVPWAMVFPAGGPLARHPSQLYEALLEGVVLFGVLNGLARIRPFKPGQLASLFLIGYGLARFCVEFFREPDVQLGFVLGSLSMGQVLSLGMIGIGGVSLVFLGRSQTD